MCQNNYEEEIKKLKNGQDVTAFICAMFILMLIASIIKNVIQYGQLENIKTQAVLLNVATEKDGKFEWIKE